MIEAVNDNRLSSAEQKVAAQDLLAMQDTLKNVLKTITIHSPSTAALQTYTNTHDHYTLSYPSTWSVHENVTLSGPTDKNAVGTVLAAPSGYPFSANGLDTVDHVRVAVLPVCPDLAHDLQPTPNPTPVSSVTIDGKTFLTAKGGEGAAGSEQDFTVYTFPKDATHCIVMTSNIFFSNPDMYDEPQRSQGFAAVAAMRATLAQIVASLHIIK